MLSSIVATVLTFWWQQQSLADPIGFLFGHGIGSAYTGAYSISVGHIAASSWAMEST